MCPRIPEPEYEFKPLNPIRKAIAGRVEKSFREIPRFDLVAEVDASGLKAVRERFKKKSLDPAPGYNDFFIFTCSRVLIEHERLNAHYDIEKAGIKIFKEKNISFAAATPEGVLLPVVRNADRKSLAEIAAETTRLSNLARELKLRASLQMHGTFGVSSLGGYGIDSFNAIISPPQVAILAAGVVTEKPRVREGKIIPVPVLRLTLTVDHRAVDGADGAAFLSDLKDALEGFDEG